MLDGEYDCLHEHQPGEPIDANHPAPCTVIELGKDVSPARLPAQDAERVFALCTPRDMVAEQERVPVRTWSHATR